MSGVSNSRTARFALAGLPITIGLATVVAISSGASAKPKLTIFGFCTTDTACTNTVAAKCANLYCKALDLECEGNYGSGGPNGCRDVKEEYDLLNCSLVPEGCGGGGLPRILRGQLSAPTTAGTILDQQGGQSSGAGTPQHAMPKIIDRTFKLD